MGVNLLSMRFSHPMTHISLRLRGSKDEMWYFGLHDTSHRMHGYGHGVLTRGVYKGSWYEGECTGDGLLISPTESYCGGFLDGLTHGFGVMVTSNFTYEGDWQNGKRHGRGRYIDRQHLISRDGDWVDDQLVGQYTGVLANGDWYTATYVNGQVEGKVLFYFSTGADKIEMDFTDGLCTSAMLEYAEEQRKVFFPFKGDEFMFGNFRSHRELIIKGMGIL